MSRYLKCPFCGYDKCEADFVDIGVGEQQCGPYVCMPGEGLGCGAVEMSPDERFNEQFAEGTELSPEEKKYGWWKPERFNQDQPKVPGVNTINNTPVDIDTARELYGMGLLDKPVKKGGS